MTASAFQEDQSTAETRIIAFWHGSLSDIPKGWVLADGNNGTLDMRSRFLKPPTDYSNGAGATGGQDTVNLFSSQLPYHDHDGSVDSAGSHRHKVVSTSLGYSGTRGEPPTASGYNRKTSSNGSHSHGGDSTQDTGSGNGIDNRPQHQEVAIIEKL